MSRHRDVRNLDYDEEYDEAYSDSVYGHSVDDHEYGLSPSVEQYMYSQRGEGYGFGAYLNDNENIKEEDGDSEECQAFDEEKKRRDSSNFERPRLSSEDEIKVNSVLDEIRNVVGEQFSEAELVRTIIANDFNFEKSLDVILNQAHRVSSSDALGASSRTRGKPHIDDVSIFSPFSYMLPLSYSFSSAFIFEGGVFERVSAHKIVKDWHKTTIRKLRDKNAADQKLSEAIRKLANKLKTDDTVSIEESFDSGPVNEFKEMMISDSPSGSLDPQTTDDSLNNIETLSSVSRDDSDTLYVPVRKEQEVASGSDQPFKCDAQSSKMNTEILQIKTMSEKKTFTYNNENVFAPTFPLSNLHSEVPQVDFNRTSFSRSHPQHSSVNNIQSSLIPSLPPLFDNPSVISTPLSFNTAVPETGGLSSLASLHAKHQNETTLPKLLSSSGINIPSISNRPKIPTAPNYNFSPPICSFLDKTNEGHSLANLATAHLNVPHNSNKLNPLTSEAAAPLIPSLSSSLKQVNESFARNKENHSIEIPTSKFGVSQPFGHMGTQGLNYSLTSSHEMPLSVSSPKARIHHMNQKSEYHVEIDLNLALKREAISSEDLKPSSMDEDESINDILYIPHLSNKEKRLLKSKPSSLFGSSLIKPKRKTRSKKMVETFVHIHQIPFDFSVPSGDDLIRKILRDRKDIHLYKILKRERDAKKN